MARETKAAKAARVGALCAEYSRLTEQVAKAEADLKTIKEQLREVEAGAYGDWSLGFGKPRVILDHSAVRQAYAERGEAVPMTRTTPPLNVKPKA